jgi:hypothetical protein
MSLKSMHTAKPAVQKRCCNLIWSSKSPEFGLPVEFPGIVLFINRYKNSVKPGKLLLTNNPQVPLHLPTNRQFDYSLSPAKNGSTIDSSSLHRRSQRLHRQPQPHRLQNGRQTAQRGIAFWRKRPVELSRI